MFVGFADLVDETMEATAMEVAALLLLIEVDVVTLLLLLIEVDIVTLLLLLIEANVVTLLLLLLLLIEVDFVTLWEEEADQGICWRAGSSSCPSVSS